MPEKRELSKLIRQVQKGDLDAFGKLYDRYYNPVYAFVLHQVAAVADAEDITAGVFLEALEKINGFSWRGAGFEAWLFSIARHDVLDHFRRRGRNRESAINDRHMDIPAAKHVETTAEAAWDRQTLRDAIWQLSDDQQQVLLLKLMVNFSNGQIAAVLSKSEGAVKALQHRALINLRKILEGNDD